jgi:hypothetical protein
MKPKIKFSLKNHPTEHDAYVAWELAKDLLDKYQIPYYADVMNQEIFVTTEFTGKMVFSKVFSISFQDENDLMAFQLIKD